MSAPTQAEASELSLFQKLTAFFIGVKFYAFVLLTRNLPVIMAESLNLKFNMTEVISGQYRGLYYLTYCLAHLPMAYALDRFGPRWVIFLSVLLCTIGLTPMIWSDSTMLLILGRMLLGVGSSTAILSIFKINRAFFQPSQFALLLGIAGTTGYISSIAGFGPLQRMVEAIGYEKTVFGILIWGVVLTLSSLIISPVKSMAQEGFISSVKTLARHRGFWTVSIIGGLMIWGTEGFADGWSVPLLMSFFKFDTTFATDITSLIFGGFAIGSILLPIIGSKYWSNPKLFGFSGLILSISLLGLFIPEIPLWFVIAMYLSIGVFSAYQVLCIDLAGSIVPISLSTLASAATNMVIMSFGYIFHSVSGILFNGKGVFDPAIQVKIYTKSEMLFGLLPFVVCALLAYIINRMVYRTTFQPLQG